MITYEKFVNRCGSYSYNISRDGVKIGYIQPVVGSCNRPTGRWSYAIEGVSLRWNSFPSPKAAIAALAKKVAA